MIDLCVVVFDYRRFRGSSRRGFVKALAKSFNSFIENVRLFKLRTLIC